MRAQSSGEWPGSRVTLRLGFEGAAECVGGGARPPPPPPPAPRLGMGARARCAELAAGNWASVGGRGRDWVGSGGGGIKAEADVDVDAGAVDCVEVDNVGTVFGASGVMEKVGGDPAFGVVGDSGSSMDGDVGGEGGDVVMVVVGGRGGGGMEDFASASLT